MNPQSDVIRSRDNALVKRVARLAESGRDRAAEGVAVLEGWHVIRACLDAPAFGIACLERLLVCETVLDAPETRATLGRARGVPLTVVGEAAFARIGPTAGPNAAVAIIDRTGMPVPVPSTTAFELWLEDVQDPGNVGTLIRSAAAAGVTAVRLSTGCADPWSPKVLRAGMGGQFVVPLETDADLLGGTRSGGLTAYAFALDGATELFDTPLPRPLALVLGNEGAGVSPDLIRAVGGTLRIPMPGPVESLNVAAAGAVALFEVVRRERGVVTAGMAGSSGL